MSNTIQGKMELQHFCKNTTFSVASIFNISPLKMLLMPGQKWVFLWTSCSAWFSWNSSIIECGSWGYTVHFLFQLIHYRTACYKYRMMKCNILTTTLLSFHQSKTHEELSLDTIRSLLFILLRNTPIWCRRPKGLGLVCGCRQITLPTSDVP